MNWFKQSQYNQYGIPLDFEERTGIPFYDDTLSEREMEWRDNKTREFKSGPLKQYLEETRNIKSKIEYMSPDEYINLCTKGFYGEKNKGFSFDEARKEIIKYRRNPVEENGSTLIDIYKKRWFSGENPPMGFIEYRNGKFWGQEGLHRAIMAKDLGVQLIPVLILNKG